MRSELLKDASDELGRRFFDIVRRQDREALLQLINIDYPGIYWGKYFQVLSQEDQRWAFRSMAH